MSKLYTQYWYILHLFLLCIGTTHGQSVVQGQNFGYTPGQFAVSDAGAATYQIPFVLPPGTASLQPKIGISYSSQNGNSYLGLGWNLNGLSTISRSTRTHAQDETADVNQQTKSVATGITYDKNDRFSLDGERLVLAPQSILTNQTFDVNYGNNQTAYYTEQNSFTKVVLTENATATSPDYFTAYTKSGLIFQYGNSTDSRIVSNSPSSQTVAIQWLVNRIEDRNGNYMTFSYTQNSTTGEVYPSRIDYTGSSGIAPYNNIRFVYEDRPDQSNLYGIRYQQKNTYAKRLKSVEVYYQNTRIRAYNLSYTLDQYSLLTQINETDGGVPGQSFNPTTFEWSNETTSLGTAAEITTGGIDANRLFGDFNGDGLTDMATYSVSGATLTVQFYLNNGDRTFTTSITQSGTVGNNYRVQVGELNGDALNDIFVTYTPASAGADSYLYFLSNPPPGQPYTCAYYTKTGTLGDNVRYDFPVDLNRDGITDFVDLAYPSGVPTISGASVTKTLPTTAVTSTYYQSLSTLTGYSTGLNFTNPDQVFEDLNGDGLTDLLLYDKATGNNVIIWTEATRTVADAATRKTQFQARLSRYDRNSSIPPSWLVGTNNTVLFVDANSDGLLDLLVYRPGSNQLCIYPNQGGYPNGSGVAYLFGAVPAAVSPICLNLPSSVPSSFTGVYPSDANADGLLDMTFFNATDGTNYSFINTGNFAFNASTPQLNVWPVDMFKSANQFRIGSFLKGSQADLYYFRAADSKYYIQRLRQYQGYSLKKITNGAGLVVQVKYDNMLNNALYERAGQVTFPNLDVQTPLYVVSQTKTRTSTGDETAKTYHYKGATINTEGRGFRGFSQMWERDTITGNYNIRYYRQDADNFKYTGQTLIRSEQYYPNDVLISKTEIFPTLINYPATYPTSFAAYDQRAVTTDYVNGKTRTVLKSHDDFGNPLYVVVDYGAGLRDSTASTYTNDQASWILGRLTNATLYRYAPSQPTITRQSSFTYDTASGLLTQELADANLTAQEQVTKTYTYDASGNITQSSTHAWTGTGFDTRTMQTEYDAATRRFAVKVTNPLGQTATTAYDVRFGVPILVTDPNSLTSSTEYDGFSRPVKQTGPDGSWKTIAYWKASTVDYQSPAEAVFLTYTKTSAGQEGLEQFDSYNRAVRTQSRGLDGRWVQVDHTYSRVTSPEHREKIRDSFPYYANESPGGYSEKQLDNLGRLITTLETKTGGVRSANMVYGGLVTEQYNYKNQKKTEIEDAKDRLVQSSWQNGLQVYYTYDAADRLLTIKDLKGNTITNEYDARGYKVRMTDPDMGTYRYEYNGFGELTKQTYPNGDVVTMQYDRIGRLISQTEREGTTTYTFDQGNKGIGRLSSVVSYVSSQTLTYDNLGRKATELLGVNGQVYTTTYSYDSQSRIDQLTYPASGLVLRHVYNTYGYLTELRNDANNGLFWKVLAMDAKGDVTQQQFGNGVVTEKQYEAATNYLQRIKSTYNGTTLQEFTYQFNDLAHLMERQDVKRGKRESFEYDDVNRLSLTYLNGTATDTVRYDELGNITYKSGVGTYEYGGVNNGPHRLLNVRTNNANVQCSFTLDIATEFTSFNKVKRIANDTAYAEIYYGPDKQRVMQKLYEKRTGSQTYTLIRTKIYVNGGLVEVESFAATGRTKITSYVGGIGIVVKETQGVSTTTTTKYTLKDHLGSITGFTGDNGVLLEEMSFDAWGQRRNADWTALSTLFKGSHERGFTDHEHYDLFSLIDMNGRVYDPVLGRFLSPDPFIQDMTDLQALNRYSYCNNNPLSYTDPSGYSWASKLWKKAKELVKTAIVYVVREVVTAVVAAIPVIGPYLAVPAGNFAANFTGTLLNGGSLKNAFSAGVKGAINSVKGNVLGALNAGLTNAVGDLAQLALGGNSFGSASFAQQAAHVGIETIGHGVIQGTMGVLNGDKFSHGFAAGAASGFADPFISGISSLRGADNYSARVNITSFIGGTASLLAGGSYENGANSGAFVRMYNAEAPGHGNSPQTFSPQNGQAESSFVGFAVIVGVAFIGIEAAPVALGVLAVRGLSRFVGEAAVEEGAVVADELIVHGNSLNSTRSTWGYKLYSNDGTFLKNGITSNVRAESRYTKSFMSDKYMEKQLFPNRRAAYEWESQQNQIMRGPLNKNMH
ncbi:RHS repeat-associated core domain-containing protein [Spirosoma endbachense]|uniref:Uncharacterized protein n=1 Tax=Spirosoma endbachense TaxID=2666025 RepID=A0A6P1VT93_9BACT|nr:RHS repeat-associated core domain-containing protein [Spirosoma endbachense]QHV95638.1 hypothetical protein GJR95_11760 [Spirosoma endbachense]